MGRRRGEPLVRIVLPTLVGLMRTDTGRGRAGRGTMLPTLVGLIVASG